MTESRLRARGVSAAIDGMVHDETDTAYSIGRGLARGNLDVTIADVAASH